VEERSFNGLFYPQGYCFKSHSNFYNMKAFHAYDIRGIYNLDFNKEDVYKVGYWLPRLLKTDKVLVGRDTRVSSPEIFEYLSMGITDSGADVYDAGLTTTPMIYYTTASEGFDASVMITASHNDKEYNGIKVSKTNALPVGYDNGLGEIENLMKSGEIVVSKQKGRLIPVDAKTSYLEYLKKYIPDISNLKISIDCSNGMVGLLIRDLLGNTPQYLFEELDGTFPNHSPNPLKLSNLKQLQEAVLENGSDIGVIFDGDADRVMFVDEKGEFIPPDLMIAVMAEHFLKNCGNSKPKVIHDIRTSRSVSEHIRKLGGEPYIWKVGRAFAALKLREIDGLFGGELAGHYYFKDFFYSDSGILASMIILNLINEYKLKGKGISEIIKEIVKYHNTGEINFTIQEKHKAMEKLKNYFIKKEQALIVHSFDGYRIEFSEWWFNIRPSNTEPYLRLIIEANTKQLLDDKFSQIKALLDEFILKN
jgi:phosphomannomutase